MKVLINDQEIEFEGKYLMDLVDQYLGDNQNGIAIAVNETVVSKHQWKKQIINESDAILIIQATQGG